jgi:SAM-dependent methyltransferase
MIDFTRCPLCGDEDICEFHCDRRRSYLRCADCALVFVPPGQWPDRDRERAEYDLHRNVTGDAGYEAFLMRLAEPLMRRLAPGARGLDFGCGPGPALAAMLRRRGYEVSLYDVFYQPDESALADEYDFICATEVVEHLHRPGPELQRLWSLLLPGGWMGIMTKLVLDQRAFADWHYKNDPTHVCFFSAQTWRWWARRQGARVEFVGADVILLGKD